MYWVKSDMGLKKKHNNVINSQNVMLKVINLT